MKGTGSLFPRFQEVYGKKVFRTAVRFCPLCNVLFGRFIKMNSPKTDLEDIVNSKYYLSSKGRRFSTFILRYVDSKFTLLTYLMENNTVITVISYCTKGLNNSKTKQKPIPTIHNKSIKSRVFNLTEGS